MKCNWLIILKLQIKEVGILLNFGKETLEFKKESFKFMNNAEFTRRKDLILKSC